MASSSPSKASKQAAKDAGADDGPQPLLELKLHATIRFLQLQNGLRHGDYQRYRHYTTRRLRRLRTRAKATHHGRGKVFTSKPVTVEAIGGCGKLRGEHLLLNLLNAERAWAFAQQLKQDGSVSSHRKAHLIRRLRRAAIYAARLQDLTTQCTGRVCERTLLEVEAYACWMGSLPLMEMDKWADALNKLSTAHSILSQLSEVGTLEDQDLFANRTDEVLQSVRYCQYNLGMSSTHDTEALLHDMRANRADLVPQALRDKLEVVLASARREQAGHLEHVTWGHRQIPLTTEQIRLAVLKVEEAVKQLQEATPSDKDAQYTQVYSAYDEALAEVGREEAVVGGMSSGAKVAAQQTSLRLLRTYLQHSKIHTMMQRNQGIISQLMSSQGQGGSGRPEDLVHVYSALQQNAADLTKLFQTDAATTQDSQELDLDDVHAQAQALEVLYRGHRAFHLANYYANTNVQAHAKLPQALVLYEHAGRLAGEAEDALEGLGDKDMAAHREDAAKLKALASGGRQRALALCVVRGGPSSSADQLAAALANLSLNANTSTNAPKTGGGKRHGHGRSPLLLMDRLGSLEGGDEADNFAIAALPPQLEPMRAKPQLFDIAFNFLDSRMPDLSAKAGAPQREPGLVKRASSGLFGWFRG